MMSRDLNSRGYVNPPIQSLVTSWVLMFTMIFLATHGVVSFETGGSDAGAGSLSGVAPTRHMGLLGYVVFPGIAYSIVCWRIVSNLTGVLSIAAQMKTLMLLAGATICSAVWSQDPFRSSYNGAFYLIGTLFAFYLVVRFSPTDIMTLVMMTGVSMCVLDLIVVVLFPQYGRSPDLGRDAGAWNGLFIDRNASAKCLTFLLSPALVFGHRGRRHWRWAYILLLFGSIVMTRAFSALVVLFLYSLFVIALQIFRKLERKAVVAVSMILLIVSLSAIAGGITLYTQNLFGFFGRDLTLTGRTDIWALLMTSIAKRPAFGYGFYSFWLGMTGESANVISAAHWFFGYAHNGYLDIVLQLGFLGLALFVTTLFQAFKDILTCLNHQRSIGVDWYIGLIVLTVLYNIDEETVLWPNDLLSILYVVACCGLSIAARQARTGLPTSYEPNEMLLTTSHDLSLAL
jgi:exopolysaccharide production protein ExoQ